MQQPSARRILVPRLRVHVVDDRESGQEPSPDLKTPGLISLTGKVAFEITDHHYYWIRVDQCVHVGVRPLATSATHKED